MYRCLISVHMCEWSCVCMPVPIHHRMYVEVKSQPQLSVLVFFLVLHMFSCLLHHQANWPMTFQEVCLHLPSQLRSVGVTYVGYYTQLCIGSWKLSSDLQACVTRTLHMSVRPSLYSQPSFQHLPSEFTESALQAKNLYRELAHTSWHQSGSCRAQSLPNPWSRSTFATLSNPREVNMGNLGPHSSFSGFSSCHGKSTLDHLLWANANILEIYNWEFNSFQNVRTFLSLFYSFQAKNIKGKNLVYYNCWFIVVFEYFIYLSGEPSV